MAGLLLLAGCTVPQGSAADLPPSVGLGDADVAVYVTEFTNDGTHGGRVVLYDRAGPTSMVANAGIMNPGLIWDQTGLFFVDQATDFQVSDQVERNTRSRVADQLVGMQAGAVGRRVVLFNDGVSAGQNHTGVGVYDGVKELSQVTLLDATGDTYSFCGGGIYFAGPTMSTAERSELIRLDPPGGGSPQRISGLLDGALVGSANAPCSVGSIIALWRPGHVNRKPSDPPPEPFPLELWKWNTVDGSVKRTRMVAGSKSFSLPEDSIVNAQVPSWLVGGDLVWVDNSGTAWRSDLKSGQTVKVRDGLPVTEGPIDSWVKSGDWVVRFEYSEDQSSGRLLVFSAKDLSLVETRELPRLAEVTPKDQMVLAVAVRPGFAPGK